MHDEGRNDDELDKIRQASGARLRRTRERATEHETRRAILDILAEDGGRAELTEAQVSARLPGKRRGNDRHTRHHLDVLHRCGLVRHNGGDPRLYQLV